METLRVAVEDVDVILKDIRTFYENSAYEGKYLSLEGNKSELRMREMINGILFTLEKLCIISEEEREKLWLPGILAGAIAEPGFQFMAKSTALRELDGVLGEIRQRIWCHNQKMGRVREGMEERS